jgi:hypothetical protein
MDTGNTSLVFKKSDLIINSMRVPNQMTENDIMCVNCYNQILKNPLTNVNKARIDILVNILEKEMDKNEINLDVIFEKLDTEMSHWQLLEAEKSEYLIEVMNIIEIAIHDESGKISALNQIRNMLSLNFDVKPSS